MDDIVEKDCFIDGEESTAKEARSSGIVIEKK